MTSRENNYDLLRIIASIAIVSLHVSASYLEAATDKSVFGDLYTTGLIWSSFYNVFARFAVPCFIMLAGAFALSQEENCNYSSYYKKIYKKIYIPTFVFSALYVIYSMVLVLLSNHLGENGSLISPLIEALKGVPFSHLWYLYMMVGVYLLVPVIIRVKKSVSRKSYIIMATTLMIASSIGYMFSSNTIKWDPGFSIRFVAYFMFGDIIRSSITQNKKSNWKAIACLTFACLIFLIITFFRAYQAKVGISNEDLAIKLVDPLCPWIIIASLTLFLGFSYISISKNFSRIASLTFYVYLVHAGIWSVMFLALKRIGKTWNNAIVIPLSIFVVFMCSCLVAKILISIEFTNVRKYLLIKYDRE